MFNSEKREFSVLQCDAQLSESVGKLSLTGMQDF